MIKVRLLKPDNTYYEDSYKRDALEAFENYTNHNDCKVKHYKNGNTDIWLSKTQYKCGSYLISNLRVESIPLEVTGRK